MVQDVILPALTNTLEKQRVGIWTEDDDGYLDLRRRFRKPHHVSWGQEKVQHAYQADRTASTKTRAPSRLQGKHANQTGDRRHKHKTDGCFSQGNQACGKRKRNSSIAISEKGDET